MPSYDYSCTKCQFTEEYQHSIKEEPKYDCPKCGFLMKRCISPNIGGFTFKYGTPSIHQREKDRRNKKVYVNQQRMETRYRHSLPTIKPNIAGVETGTWSDAQKMAKEAGLNHESYTPLVEKEKKNKKIIVSSR